MSSKTSIHDFERAIKQAFGCLSALHSRRVVHELFRDTVWEAEVLTFDLLNHPTAARCSAWSIDGKVPAVLHDGPVDSPRAAVRSQVEAARRSDD